MRRIFPVLLLVFGLLLTSSVPAYAQPNAYDIIVNHVVQPGETVFCIARAYKVSPAAIINTNLVPYPNWIYPGQVLAIPDVPAWLPPGPTCARQDSPTPPPACTCAQYYTVVAGDNLYRISLKFDVNMWRIAECNKIHNLNYIRVGDVLCIPSE
ncbi:MAG: LysM peptidoglycan-binding domain-containing protein [Anaerolineae bacterium]